MRRTKLRSKITPKRRRQLDERWTTLRRMVLLRCGGRCERCGRALGEYWECHHRKLRSQGGPDDVRNLIALHPDCHNPGSPGSVHHSPRIARQGGYMVPGWADPAVEPLLLWGSRWVLLTEGGTYAPTPAPDGIDV